MVVEKPKAPVPHPNSIINIWQQLEAQYGGDRVGGGHARLASLMQGIMLRDANMAPAVQMCFGLDLSAPKFRVCTCWVAYML